MPSSKFLGLIRSDSFLILFTLFIIALEFNELEKLNMAEILFMVYALGFTLEKVAAMQEHGIKGLSPSSLFLATLIDNVTIHSLL